MICVTGLRHYHIIFILQLADKVKLMILLIQEKNILDNSQNKVINYQWDFANFLIENFSGCTIENPYAENNIDKLTQDLIEDVQDQLLDKRYGLIESHTSKSLLVERLRNVSYCPTSEFKKYSQKTIKLVEINDPYTLFFHFLLRQGSSSINYYPMSMTYERLKEFKKFGKKKLPVRHLTDAFFQSSFSNSNKDLLIEENNPDIAINEKNNHFLQLMKNFSKQLLTNRHEFALLANIPNWDDDHQKTLFFKKNNPATMTSLRKLAFSAKNERF